MYFVTVCSGLSVFVGVLPWIRMTVVEAAVRGKARGYDRGTAVQGLA